MIESSNLDNDIKYLPKIEQIPREVRRYLDLPKEEVIVLVESDLSFNTNGEVDYGRSYLILTNKRLLILNSNFDKVSDTNLSSINYAYLRNHLGVMILVIEINGVPNSVFIASHSKKKILEKVVTLINDLTLHKIPYEIFRKNLISRLSEFKEDEYFDKKSKKSVLISLIQFIKPLWHLLALATFLSILVTLMNLVPPYLMKILIDEVLIPKDSIEKLMTVILSLLGVRVSLTILSVIKQYILLKINQKLASRLRIELYEHIQRLSLNFQHKFSVGSIISRIMDDVNRILYFLTQGLSIISLDITMVVFVGIILFSINPLLASIAIIPIPISLVGTLIYRKVMPKYYHKLWRKWSRIVSVLSDTLSAFILVKSFGKEGEMIGKFRRNINEYVDTHIDVFKKEQRFWPLIDITFTISSLLVWGIGGLQVLNDKLTLGSLTAFVSYMWMFYNPINELIFHLGLVNQVIVAGERILEILRVKPDVRESPNAIEVNIKGKIEFKDVWFTYDGIHYALKGINLIINEGEHIGIVGPSGSGKSTLAKLILRLFEPQRGAILIDGIDIRNIKLSSLRKQIAIVLQNPILFNVSIAENIAMGKVDAKPEEIIAAAKAAKAHDFIMKLPEAYDTEVGISGSKLSGGERQRIAIAAAILKDPKILILDEPTSSLDALTEKEVTEAIENLSKNRTTIIITHRLSTLKNVDRIIVIDKGSIVEEGSHEELISSNGLYKRMFEAQMKEFLEQRQVVIRR